MLNQQQASQIVGACIRVISHVNTVDLTGTLDDAQIKDSGRVTRVINQIVNEPKGVRSLNHQIDVGFFRDIGPSTPVFDVIDIVRKKSTRIPADDTKSAGKKSGKKAAKKKAAKSKSKKTDK